MVAMMLAMKAHAKQVEYKEVMELVPPQYHTYLDVFKIFLAKSCLLRGIICWLDIDDQHICHQHKLGIFSRKTLRDKMELSLTVHITTSKRIIPLRRQLLPGKS